MEQHHKHGHQHEVLSTLSFDEKIIKLLEHWIKHNEDHANTYRDWAKKAKTNNLDHIDSLLQDAADMNISINRKFEEAVRLIKKG